VIEMNKLRLTLLFQAFVAIATAQEITVNQVGYLTGQMKLAIVPAAESGEFYVIDNVTNAIRYTANLSSAATWSYAGQSVRIADFTAFNDTGTFRIETQSSTISSYPFRISGTTFRDLSGGSLKFYYLDRASIPILEEYAGMYARAEGHPDTAVIVHASAASPERPEGTIISTPGGWYDAGDYNKYVVNAGISNYTVFAIAEDFPDYAARLDLNIPESSNSVPDIIDEGIYDLRWMLSMQDPNDGGVYHKCTEKNFSAFVTPAQASGIHRYVVMKTTAATLDMAAVAAQASRILRDYEADYPGLADSCLDAALYAYEWARAHPAVYYQQPSDIATGAYGDNNVSDEFRWAALELYITTNDDQYLSHYNYLDRNAYAPGWPSVYPLGLISLIHNADLLTAAVDLDAVKQKIIDYANTFYNDYINSAYKVPITVFNWGSNSGVANGGIMSLQAYYITGEEKYKNAAIATLDYLLGRNPTLYSYVTGYGSKTPMHPHDRKSESDGIVEPIPGMLVGGANPYNTTDCGGSAYPSTLPALSYLDELCSYSTNEIAINWNAPLAYLSCALQYLQQPRIVKAYTDSDDSTLLYIGFDLGIESSSAIAGDFSLKVNDGTIHTLNDAAVVDNSTILLQLDTYISVADTNILLSYTQGDLTSEFGASVESFDSVSVLNMIKGSTPVLISAYTDTHAPVVYLKFSKIMDAASPYITDFSMSLSGNTIDLLSAETDHTDTSLVILTADTSLTYMDTLTVSYSGSNFGSLDGGKLRHFINMPVMNKFFTPAVLSQVTINHFGNELRLQFSKNMTDTSMHAEEFSFTKNDNSEVAITGASIDPTDMRRIQFELGENIEPSDTGLKISYTGNRLLSAQLIHVNPFGPVGFGNTTTYPHAVPGTVEAEEFVENAGYDFESCSDEGGGQDLTHADAGDHIDYLIDVSGGGLYTITYRVASSSSTARFETIILPDSPIDTITVHSTGGIQEWTSLYSLVNLNAGEQLLRIETAKSAFNLNWIKFEEGDAIPDALTVKSMKDNRLRVYPNPVHRNMPITFEIVVAEEGFVDLEIIDIRGKVVGELYHGNIHAGRNALRPIFIDHSVSPGLYIVNVKGTTFNDKLLLSIE
jgi:endoglucanase